MQFRHLSRLPCMQTYLAMMNIAILSALSSWSISLLGDSTELYPSSPGCSLAVPGSAISSTAVALVAATGNAAANSTKMLRTTAKFVTLSAGRIVSRCPRYADKAHGVQVHMKVFELSAFSVMCRQMVCPSS